MSYLFLKFINLMEPIKLIRKSHQYIFTNFTIVQILSKNKPPDKKYKNNNSIQK
jgi:hypothetical protein